MATRRLKTMKKSQQQAPDAHVTLSDGTRRRLSAFWQEGHLVLVFLRHLG
jgi:hypothetical protein